MMKKKTWNSSELACALLCLLIVRKSNYISFGADMHSVVSFVWSVRICLVYMGKNSSRQTRSFVICIFEKRHTNAEKCSNVCRRLIHDETDSLISHPFGTSYTLRLHTHTSAHYNTVPYSLFRRFLLSQLRTVSLTHIRQHAHIFTCMQKNSCISISKMVCLSMGSSILPDYYCKWNDCTLKPQNNVAAQKRATKQTKWAQSAINDVYLWITYARAFLVVAFFLDLLPFEWSDLMVLRRNKLYAFCFYWLKF